MATWHAKVELPNKTHEHLYFSAADARSMTRKALNAAVRNAAKRAHERFARRGLKVVVLSVECVG